MVACKFFLQGNCKFGSFCNFEHQIPSKYSYSRYENNQPSTSILRQSAFGTQNAAAATAPSTAAATPNIEALVNSVIQDMTGAEKGGQWLLSCYAPFKEKPAFPGFEDQSPEEIRLGFYEAQKTGTVEQYKQQLQSLLQNTLLKVKALQSPSPEVMGLLQNIYNSPSSGTNASNIFASPSGGSGFGQGSQGIFGAAPSQPSSNIFGAPPQPGNIFAANATSPNQSQNIFAANTANFGASPFNQQPSNIFAAAPQPANTNLFGANQQSGNIFATQPQNPAPSNIFTSPPQNPAPQQNVFTASPAPQTNIFTNPINQQTGGFNSPINTGSNLPPAAPPNYSASIFGNLANATAAPTAALGNPTQQINLEFYSKIEELSEEDKKWFQSKELDLNIPDKPPTYEMCFPK